jgi:solute carrier family 13 (sodium-dependent dicarboxylate transporter), member 2/3/5
LLKDLHSQDLSGLYRKRFHGMEYLSPLLFVLIVSLNCKFFTELTSNTAVAQMILPIMASVSIALGMHPYLLMIAATISSSMAFMLPVATPPNTIVFAKAVIVLKVICYLTVAK